MQLGQTFQRSQLPSSDSYEPVPAGWYEAAISSAEVCATKAGNGEYIKIKYTITGPTHEGRVVFSNLNIKNPNQKAVEIAYQELNKLMGAINLEELSDTDQMVGAVLSIKLSVRPETEQFPASNDVKGYKSLSGSVPPMPVATQEKEKEAAPPWAMR